MRSRSILIIVIPLVDASDGFNYEGSLRLKPGRPFAAISTYQLNVTLTLTLRSQSASNQPRSMPDHLLCRGLCHGHHGTGREQETKQNRRRGDGEQSVDCSSSTINKVTAVSMAAPLLYLPINSARHTIQGSLVGDEVERKEGEVRSGSFKSTETLMHLHDPRTLKRDPWTLSGNGKDVPERRPGAWDKQGGHGRLVCW